MNYKALPGGEILEKGLRDLNNNSLTIEGLLVLAGAPRFRAHGIPVPKVSLDMLPEHKLYDKLQEEKGTEAYRYYRSLIRLLASLQSALDVIEK